MIDLVISGGTLATHQWVARAAVGIHSHKIFTPYRREEAQHGVHGIPEAVIDVELIGAGAAFRGLGIPTEPLEVRLRVAARLADLARAQAVGWEVETLHTNGPAGGGGARGSCTPVVLARSCLLPRELAVPTVECWEVG
jgi:hypothetical protein